MKKTTEELLKTLQKTAEIDSFLLEEDENFKTLPLHLYLDKVFAKSEITRSQCIRNSGLDRTYCYQIFSGQKLPSRDKVLALCFGLTLGFEKTQLLLKSTGYPPLYPRNKRDSILIFALQRKHSILETNELLQDLGYELSSSESEGDHQWKYWDEKIKDVLDWWLGDRGTAGEGYHADFRGDRQGYRDL